MIISKVKVLVGKGESNIEFSPAFFKFLAFQAREIHSMFLNTNHY